MIPAADLAILAAFSAPYASTVVVIVDVSARGKTWRGWCYAGHDLAGAQHAAAIYQWAGQRIYQRDAAGQWQEVPLDSPAVRAAAHDFAEPARENDR